MPKTSAIASANEPSDLPAHWAAIAHVAEAVMRHDEELRRSCLAECEQMYASYRRLGYLDGLLREALGHHELAAILFFQRLYRDAGLRGRRPLSPVAHYADDAWMNHTDYCFLNVRATGRFPSVTGTFLDATRLLPAIRAQAIHLAPFFQNVFGIVYAQDSFSIIADQVVRADYEALGVPRGDQLRYFVDCCHLLGKAVAFDLTSHTSCFSKVSFDHPELFRWLRFSADYSGLFGGKTVDEQYQEPVQAEFVAHIRRIARSICGEHGLARLETTEVAPQIVDAVHAQIKMVVRSCGYYPVVLHTWNGVGLPGLKRYNKEGHYPEWDYRDARGDDQSAHAMGIHASFKLHTGLAANRSEYFDPGKRPLRPVHSWEPGLRYLSGLFPQMHAEYGFDFLRIDCVDHVFLGTQEEDGREYVVSEQLDPGQLRAIAAAAKAAFPPAGMLADHVGSDIDRYRRAGFTAILGTEVQAPLHKETVLALFHLNYQLEQRASNAHGGTVVFPIDTHDMGHPALKGRDLADREDRALVLLRHFFSRFSSAGVGQRPRYETLGCQDRTQGLFRANNEPVSLAWGEDRAALAAYHAVEGAYERCRDDLVSGRVDGSYVFDDHCWWKVSCAAQRAVYLACTWIGDRYDWGAAAQHAIHDRIPWSYGPIAAVHPLLGVQPAREPGATSGVELEPHRFEHHLGEDGFLDVRWPNLTSWIVRIQLA